MIRLPPRSPLFPYTPLSRSLRGGPPPAEPEPTGPQQRVGPAVDEPVELHGGAVVPAHAPERFAEPEADVARERPRRAPGPERLPRGHRLVVPAERVAREPQTVSRPRLHRRGHGAREQ